MSVSVQYHCQENQRRSSASGATTAARTPAATRPPSERPGSDSVPRSTRIGLVPARQLARMPVPFAGGDLQRARDDRPAPFQRRPQRLQLLPLQPELGAQVVDARRPRGSQMIQQPAPAAVGCAHALDLRATDRIGQAAPPRWSPAGSCRNGSRGPGSRVRQVRRTTAIWSLATSRSLSCRACTDPHGRPHTGSAACSRPCASAARGRAGTHRPPQPTRAPGRASSGTGTPGAPVARSAAPCCHLPPGSTKAIQACRVVRQPKALASSPAIAKKMPNSTICASHLMRVAGR